MPIGRTQLWLLVPLLCTVLLAPEIRAEEPGVGEAAPELGVTHWLAMPEGGSLADLRGRVVLVLGGGAGDLSDAAEVIHWNDLQAAWLAKGLRVIALLPQGPESLPPEVAYAVGVVPQSPFGGAPAPHAALIDSAGQLVWLGAPEDVPESMILTLLRKASPFVLPRLNPAVKAAASAFQKGHLAEARELAGTLEHADAEVVRTRVAALLSYWQREALRAEVRGDLAEQAWFLEQIEKYLDGAPEGATAGEARKTLKGDRRTALQCKAAAAYGRLRTDFAKCKGTRKQLDALARKAERAATSNAATPGGMRLARLAERLAADPALRAIQAFIAKEKIQTKGGSWRTSLPRPPHVSFGAKRTYTWTLETSEGEIQLRLFHESAPMHVSNILFLTELGFFDGLTFHRVIPGFMAQGGCPKGTGSGQPGYAFDGEFEGGKTHDRSGILSAANAGPGTDNSQFFITFAPAPHLDGKHTVFGVVVRGEATLEKIEKLGTPGGPPNKRIVIEKATLDVK
jgi:peptidyl-prolyl cis-trans isomerase B (cyclophilin B)